MRLSIVDTIAPSVIPTSLPIRLEQRPSTTSNILKLLVMLPVSLALLMPFLMLAQACLADPAIRDAVAARPLAAVQIGFALAFWAVLFALPMKRLVDGLVGRREILISDEAVHICERGLLGTRISSAPLSEYGGVVHHVRASLSGLRHELILAHPEHNQSVLLSISDRFSQVEIDRTCKLLGLSEAPTGAIYKGAKGRGARSVSHTGPSSIAQAA